MKIATTLFAMLLTVVFASTYAQDAPPTPPGPVTFEVLDADADGKVTLDEFKANFRPRAPEGRTPQPERVFSRWDADSDGVLTAEEFANRPRGQQGQGGQRGQQAPGE